MVSTDYRKPNISEGRRLALSLKVNACFFLIFLVSLVPELTFVTASNKIMQIVAILFLALILYCADLRLSAFKRISSVALTFPPLGYLSAYLIFGLISVAWSEDIYRTGFYASLTISCLFAALLVFLSTNNNADNLFENAKKLVSVVVIAKLIASLLNWSPSTPILEHFHGVAAFESLVLVILIVCDRVRTRELPILTVLLMIIAFSTSVKTYFSFVAFIFTSVFLMVSSGKKIGIFLLLCTVLGFGYLTIVSLPDYSVLGRLEHGSGRLSIYTYLIEKYIGGGSMEKSIGFGYAAGDKFELENVIFYNAHNVFLSALINLGVLGLGLQALIFFSALRPFLTIRRVRDRRFACLGGGVAASLINALANHSIAGPVSGPFLCTVVLLILLTLMMNDNTRPRHYSTQ